ncbi:MAG: hypothetical protein EXX96DRAFT_603007 [Benjaminiella poitrasii]|nr:MAG: hypothetical protein EXX96DRAFT_603007 [Benjaminiella poitrasii]
MPLISLVKESFAFAPINDREEVVKKLAADNTEEALYYQGLVLLQKIYDQVMKYEEPVKPREPTVVEKELSNQVKALLAKMNINSGLFRRLNVRFNLLIYPFDTATSTDFIKSSLYIDLETSNANIEKPETSSDFQDHESTAEATSIKPIAPSVLDANLIESSTVVKESFRRLSSGNDTVLDINPSALSYLDTCWDSLSENEQAALLNKIWEFPSEHAFGPKIIDRLAKLWRAQDNTLWHFENLSFYNFTLTQMDQLIDIIPDIVFLYENFIVSYLDKLIPPEYNNNQMDGQVSFWNDDSGILSSYLDRLDVFASKLPSMYFQLKSVIKLHKLRMDISRKDFVLERLISYLSSTSDVSANTTPVPSHLGFGKDLNINKKAIKSPNVTISIPFLGSCSISEFDKRFVIEKYLEGLVTQDKLTVSIESLGAYADYHNFLKPLYAKLMLTATSSTPQEAWINTLGHHEYKALINKTILSFSLPTLKTSFKRKPMDNIRLGLVTKNIQCLSIRVFQIETENYWRLHLNDTDEFAANNKIKLDGLCPTFEMDVNTFSSVPPLQTKSTEFLFGQDGLAPDVFRGRGLWAIDFIGGQHQCRTVVQKGYLKHIMQETSAGHVFRILDEDGRLIKKAKIWCNNQYYKANEHENILIPYLPSDGKSKSTRIILMSPEDGFCEPASFYHLTEKYKFNASFYVNSEMIYSNKKSSVVVIPTLTLNGSPVPLSLLDEKISLIVDSRNDKGVKKSSIYQCASSDANRIVFDFVVPDQLSQLEFRLVTKIKTINGALQDLEANHRTFYDPDIEKPGNHASIHLKKSDNNIYTLHAFGKNGEIKKDYEISIRLRHMHVQHTIDVLLKTNYQGIIELGELKNIVWLECGNSRNNCKKYRLQDTVLSTIPSSVCVPVDTSFKIACSTSFQDSCYSFYETGLQDVSIKNLSSRIVKKDGYIEVQGLPEGEYKLCVPSPSGELKQIKCTVIRNQSDSSEQLQGLWSEWLIGSQKYAKQCRNILQQPLGISNIALSDDAIKIQLRNWSSRTYAIITTNTFIQTNLEDLSNFVLNYETQSYQASYHNGVLTTRSIILDDKLISDEYQYILNRSRAVKFAGSNLTKPSLLMYPKKNASTESSSKQAQQEQVLSSRAKMARRHADPSMFYSKTMNDDGTSTMALRCAYPDDSCAFDRSLGFLDHYSPVLIIPVSAEDGSIAIDRNALGYGGQILETVIVSGEQRLFCQTVLDNEQKLRCKNLCQSLNSNKALIRAKTVSKLLPGDSLTLNTHEYEVIDSIEKLFNTIESISNVGRDFSKKFYFLKTWTNLTLEMKLELHEKHAFHEFNLWLKKKDKPFFEAYVRPAIQSKIQKSFMDLYLLDEDLSKYCKNIYHFQKLSVSERVFLATTQSKEFLQRVLREFENQFNDKQVNSQSDAIFDSILANSAVSDQPCLDTNVSEAILTRGERMASDTVSGQLASASAAFSSYAAPTFGSALRSLPFSNGFGAAPAVSNEQSVISISSESNMGIIDDSQDAVVEEETNALREMAKERQKNASYKFVGPTNEWAETGYYSADEQIESSQFWIDYLKCNYAAENGSENPLFLSGDFMYSINNITEILYIMSLMDLPFASNTDWKIETDGSSYKPNLTISTSTFPIMIFHRTLKEVQESSTSNDQHNIMLNQDIIVQDHSQYTPPEDWVKINPENQSLETHVEYGNQLVISNISSKTLTCQITVQVPTGSVPSQNTLYCDSRTVSISPYSSWHDVVSTFYFPVIGEFSMPPVAVSSSLGNQLIGLTDAVNIHVVDRSSDRSTSDATTTSFLSWAAITSSNSKDSNNDILNFLETCPRLDKLDFKLIGWRMTQKSFAHQVLDILSKRYYFNGDIWKYAVYHRFEDATSDLLYHESHNLLSAVGQTFESPLIYANNIEEQQLLVLDYYPLLNARTHSLSAEREILNRQFYNQYDEFLGYLCLKSTPFTSNELVILTLYLLLQDRIAQAHATFSRIRRDQVASCQVQYDYIDVFLKTRIPISDNNQLQQLDLKSIKDITLKYKEFGVLKWRKLFNDMHDFVCEVERGDFAFSNDASPDNKRIRSEPILEIEVNQRNSELIVQYANLKSIDVKYYEMNLEVMFSDNPFIVNQNVGQKSDIANDKFNWIKPNYTTTIDLPELQRSVSDESEDFDMIGVGQITSLQTVHIPFEKGNKNMFVEISNGSLKRYQAYFSNRLNVHIAESFGVVRVMSELTRRPVAGAYVKVYARMKQGRRIEFWKDGYTGLNGVFDYIGVTEGNGMMGDERDLKKVMEDKVDKLSILILSNDEGAVVKEAYPPLASY